MNKTELIAAAAEKSGLSKKDTESALNAVLEAVTEELTAGRGDIGSFHRFGKNFYRLRVGDFRIYFEILPEGEKIHAHYVLHKHTIADFVFRFKLPFTEETMIEQQDNFWKYLDSLKK